MKWIESTGGPFILLSDALLTQWRGCDGDYERACEIEDWLGVLGVGSREALVVNDEPMPTSTCLGPDSCLLVRWSCAPDERTVLRHLEQAGELALPAPSVVVDFGNSSVVLFDSSAAGSDLASAESLRIELPAARCAVRTLDWRPDEDTRLILHSLSPSE